jgi:hypothetical protein
LFGGEEYPGSGLVGRLTADGQLDMGFGSPWETPYGSTSPGGLVASPVGRLRGLALQPDGKFVTAGYTTGSNFETHFALARHLGDSKPARLTGDVTCGTASVSARAPIVYGGDPAQWQYVVLRTDFYRYAAGSGWQLVSSAPELISYATKTTAAPQWWRLADGADLGPTSQVAQAQPAGASSGGWITAQLILWFSQAGQLADYVYELANGVGGPNAVAPLCYWP